MINMFSTRKQRSYPRVSPIVHNRVPYLYQTISFCVLILVLLVRDLE